MNGDPPQLFDTLTRPILSKVSFSIAFFASTVISAHKGVWSVSASLFFALFLYVVTRTWLRERLEQFPGDKDHTKCAKRIVTEMVDMNWTVAAFVLGDQFVEIFMTWNVFADTLGVVFLQMNVPLVLLFAPVELYSRSRFARASVVEVVNALVDRMGITIAFYGAAVIGAKLGDVTSPVVLVVGVIVFAALGGAMVLFFSAFEDSPAKAILVKNWTLIASTIAFVLADIFTAQLRDQWARAEDVLFGAAWSNAVFTGALYLTLAIAAVHSEKLVDAGGVLDRALFAVAVTLASKANTSTLPFNEWQIFWLVIAVVLLNGEIAVLFGKWTPEDEPRRQLKRLWQQNISTWGMIAMSLAVKFLVNVFISLWTNETDDSTGIVAVVRIQIAAVLLFGLIYVIGSVFSHY